MAENKEWPCEHIDRKSCNYTGGEFGPWVYDGGCYTVSDCWIVCPECESRRPKPKDEIDLNIIFSGHACSSDTMEDLRKKILKWKRDTTSPKD